MYLSGSSQRGFPPAMWGVPYNNAHSPSLSELARDDEAALADQEEEMQAERERLGNVGPEPPEDEGNEYEDLAEMRAREMGAAAGSSLGGERLATASPAQSDASLCPWKHRNQRAAGGGDGDRIGDGLGGGRGAHLPSIREGEMPMPVSAVLTKLSPVCANPASIWATMEHFRNLMLLESDPLDEKSPFKKWYKLVTPATQGKHTDGKVVPYDGSALCVLRRMLRVLDKTTDYNSKLADVKGRIEELLAHREDQESRATWRGISIEMHMPMQRLLFETDDRDGHTLHSTNFSVNEQMVLKRGRDSWMPTDAKYRVLNTRLVVLVDNIKFEFNYVDFGGGPEPCIGAWIDNDSQDFHGYWQKADIPSQEFAELLDFAQYTEREIAEAAPDSHIPMKTLQLLALVESKNEERCIVAVLKQLGPKIRYDEGRWWSWTQDKGWSKDDSDTNIRTAVKAAATDLENKLRDMSDSDNFDELRTTALSWFDISGGPDEDRELPEDKTPQYKAKHFKIIPSSERGLSSFIANLLPWILETGFAKSFERCKDIAFKNCVQQMVRPFTRHAETPADRVTNRFECDLPPPPTSEEAAALQRFALKPFEDIFIDKDISLREADKLACLLTGTCAVMPEANIRVQIGPYNSAAGQFAGGVGKDTIGNHAKAVFGPSLSTDWGMAMLSAYIEADKNNHGFQGLETQLGHWITDGSANKRDGTESLRRWGDLPKKIWAGGAPTHFSVTLKHKDKQSILPRSNAGYVCAQRFNIGDDVAIWRRVECSPYPRVGNIPENQPLIFEGIPYFEIDPSYVNTATNMDEQTRGKHLRYLVDRAIAILKDPKAAHPPTDKHHAAKDQLKQVAGGNGGASNTAADDAYEDLTVLIHDRLRPCDPTGMQAHLDLAPQHKLFQTKAPRCFCGKKKVAEACSFRVSELAEPFKIQHPGAYAHYVQRPDRLAKLTEAVQRALVLDIGPIPQVFGVQRGTIFGFTLGEKSAADTATSGSGAALPSSISASVVQKSDEGEAEEGSNTAVAKTNQSSHKNKDQERHSDESPASGDENELSDSDEDEDSEEEESGEDSSETESDSDEDAPATSSDEDDEDDEDGPKRKKGCTPARKPVSKKQKA